MRVKIGNEWIDSSDQWLAVQFSKEELEAVKKMDVDGSNRSFASGRDEEEDGKNLLAWMREGR